MGGAGISYRDEFNDKSRRGDHFIGRAALDAVDQAHTQQVLTDTLEPEGNSLGGRLLTSTARSVHHTRLEQRQKKDREAEFLHVLEILREELRRIDEQIARLDEEIAQLREQLAHAEKRGQSAFERMHTLEDLLAETENGDFEDDQRRELKRILGMDEDESIADTALLLLAKKRLEDEQRAGIEADIEAETIRRRIEVKKAVRDELIEAREDILSDSDASPEERIARAKAALERSFQSDMSGTETTQPNRATQINRAADERLDSHRSELIDDQDFDLDDSMRLDQSMPTAPSS